MKSQEKENARLKDELAKNLPYKSTLRLASLKKEIEAAFSSLNIDDDCYMIDSLLTPLIKNVKFLLIKG